MGYQVGRDCKAYLDASGAGQGTWTELVDIEDVTEENSKNTGKVKNRKSKYEKSLSGQHMMSGTLKMTYDKTSTEQLALLAGFEDDSVVGLAVADGDIATTGTIAMMLDALITSFGRSQGVDDAVVLECNFEPHANGSDDYPDIVIIAGA